MIARQMLEVDLLPMLDERPKTRGECLGQERPCPFVSCRHHLLFDLYPKGGVEELERMDESCSLDVADGSSSTLEEVGALMGVTRERIRQLETKAMVRFARKHRGLK